MECQYVFYAIFTWLLGCACDGKCSHRGWCRPWWHRTESGKSFRGKLQHTPGETQSSTPQTNKECQKGGFTWACGKFTDFLKHCISCPKCPKYYVYTIIVPCKPTNWPYLIFPCSLFLNLSKYKMSLPPEMILTF